MSDLENESANDNHIETPELTTQQESSQISKKLTQEDKQVIESANEILDSLEHVHRTDLALHLYSSFLLKKLLYRANDKKHFFEINQYVRSQIKDNWVSWPNPNAVVDPQTDRIYEDLVFLDNSNLGEPRNVAPNEVSKKALHHANAMLHLELSSHWQHLLSKSSKKSGLPLDIDNIAMPGEVSTVILNKLDHLFAGLHQKVAKKNKVIVRKEKTPNNTGSDTLSEVQIQNGITKVNRKIKLSYHNIIERGYEMQENIDNIYMKSLELFNDVPSTFKKHPFKVPKKVLKKYRNSRKGEKASLSRLSQMKDEYVLLRSAISDTNIPTEQRDKLRQLYRKQTEMGLSQKTFYEVRGYNDDNGGPAEGTSSKDLSAIVKLKNGSYKTTFSEFYEPYKSTSSSYDMRDYIVDLNELP